MTRLSDERVRELLTEWTGANSQFKVNREMVEMLTELQELRKSNVLTSKLIFEQAKEIEELHTWISGARSALELAENRSLDWDLMHNKTSLQILQDWRGKCFETLASCPLKEKKDTSHE